MRKILFLALGLFLARPQDAQALRIIKKLFAKKYAATARINLKCNQTDYRCQRKQRDIDFRRCVKMKGPFGIKSCQDARKKAALGAASFAQHAALGRARAARAASLMPQEPVRMNSAQSASMIPQMERTGRRSTMMGSGPSMGGIGGRSMVRRARDNSHLVARQARYRSNGRNRRVRRVATQGRAVSRSISAAHQRLVDHRNAAMAQQSATTSRAPRALPRSAYSASRSPFARNSSSRSFARRAGSAYSRYPASISSSPAPRESAPVYGR
jgi:hypothetical protein